MSWLCSLCVNFPSMEVSSDHGRLCHDGFLSLQENGLDRGGERKFWWNQWSTGQGRLHSFLFRNNSLSTVFGLKLFLLYDTTSQPLETLFHLIQKMLVCTKTQEQHYLNRDPVILASPSVLEGFWSSQIKMFPHWGHPPLSIWSILLPVLFSSLS